MPRFSIIVPTYGVEGRLSLALESVLGQPFGDFELIPVHEAADSPAGAVSTAYATRDTRVAPVESPPSGGLSAARNAGLSAAHGAYVLFLDGDDTLAPGALQTIADRLGEAGDPDVLYFAHERAHWWEGGTSVVHPTGPRTPARTPAWSAAYRRDFLTERQLTFPIGYFTDLGWSGLVALAAGRTAALRDTVCVRHLLRRQGSRLHTPGEHQLELLDQVELVLARATAERGVSEALFEQLFAVVLRSAAHPERLPLRHRRAFFHRATHLYRHYCPAGFHPPGGTLGVRHRLLATGSYAGFRVLSATARAAAGALAALPRPRAPLTRALYAAQRRLPSDRDLVVYRVHRDRGVACDPAAIHAKARELAPRLRAVFLVEPDAVDGLPQDVEYAVIGSPHHRRVLSRAKYLVRRVFLGERPEALPPVVPPVVPLAGRTPAPAPAAPRVRRARYGPWWPVAGRGVRGERLRAAGAELIGRGWSLAHGRLPLDPDLALYSAFSHRGVLGDPAAVYQAARDLAPHIRGVWVVRPERVAALPPGVEYVTPGSPEYLRLAARATYFVGNVAWPGTLTKRPGSVHVHTHQGTPLKFMGADLLHKPGARLGVDVPGMLRRADRWDHSLVANRHSELVWSRAYPCGFTSLRTGSPRNDVLVNAGPDSGAAVRERLGIPAGHTVVLYAPTPRDHRRGGHVERFDLTRFATDLRRGLGESHTLVVRLHPSLADGPARGSGLAELHRRGVVVDATDEPHVEELMLASDVLVTDYSALMFDYANLDRPVVVHADDRDAFAASRGMYLDITADPPGHVSRSYRELARLFDSGQWRDTESARLRAGFRERYCEFDDGRAAERVVRTLMMGERAVAVPAPRPAESMTSTGFVLS